MQAPPSSSSTTTTPSPSFPYRQPSEALDALQLADLDPQEREERQRAVQRLLARAEFSKLTRSLRARLAYASYKATNNLSHVPLPVLEDRIQPSPSPPPAPPSPHKRRAATMAPPASPSSSSRSLYSSLLGPPNKRARHVYGPANGPGSGPSPSDLLASYHATPATPRKGQPSPFSGQGRTVRSVRTVTEKEDMNAAATLTALMYNRASPRQGGGRTSTPAPPLAKPTEDADAAELMLYLATSPSPARPTVARRAPPTSMGRVLFAAGTGEEAKDRDRDTTPELSHSQASSFASQESSQGLLHPPPELRKSADASSSRKSTPFGVSSSTPFDVSRKLFADEEDKGGGGAGGGGFSLGKGIDLVEAK
ncbi:hypothetical protein BU17DRAFT_66781 [Hysterangium stoloniferum]|nr:hypothetical protein BU17DRAFT_66781 [Hysterangium stoloniferum]